jgi:GntR family transcriptional regulator/MocR family aminotransferase
MTGRGSPLDVLGIDRKSSVQLHRQIYETLRQYILQGRLAADTRLPSTRALADQLAVGRNTVIAAYDQLLAEGYVETTSGSGTRVASLLQSASSISSGAKPGCVMQLSSRGSVIANQSQPRRPTNTVNAQPAFPDIEFFPFKQWSRLIARNARKHDEDLLGYESFAGHWRLRRALANYLGVARGINCTPEQIIIVTGAQAALDLLARILIDEGDPVWIEEPGYMGAHNALLGAGARITPLVVNRRGWKLDDSQVPAPRLIYVTPSCQWPFGTVMRMEQRQKLLALAERHGAWIVEDDYDGEYRFRGSPAPALRGLDTSDRVIYVGTFGKTLLASLRLGYMVVPNELAEPIARAVSVTGQFAPLLLQATVADFIEEGHFAAHLRRTRRLYARRQEAFIKLCRRHLSEWLSVLHNDSGMQVLARFVGPQDDRVVARAALKRGLDLQPISMNYHHGKPEHGLLLGYAGLSEPQARKVVMALKATFQDILAAEQTEVPGSAKLTQSGPL